MKAARIFLSILVLLGLASSAVAEPLTLQAAIARGIAENARLKAYGIGVGEAREDVRGAWGAFLPTLGMSYQDTRLSNDSSAERDTDYLNQQSDSSTLSLSQPLFSGFAGVAGVRKSNLALEARELERKHMEAQLVREIRRDFHAVLQAQAQERLWVESIGRLRRQKEIAQAWYERELATRLRLLEVEVELSNAIQQRDIARTNLATARARLAHWLALPVPEELELAGDLVPALDDSFPALAECLELARRERPDLRIAGLNVESARQEAVLIASRNLPRASLEAAWTDYEREYDDPAYRDDLRDYYSVAVRVSFQPFQGGRNIFAWRHQRLTIQRMRELERDLAKEIDAEVRAFHSQWQDSAARLQASTDAVTQAKDAWRFAERSLELGVGSLKDLLDAETRLTRAELMQIDAQVYRQRSKAELAYAIGAEATGGP